MPTSSPVTGLVRSCASDVRPIVRALRTEVRANISQFREFIYHGAICYAPREAPQSVLRLHCAAEWLRPPRVHTWG